MAWTAVESAEFLNRIKTANKDFRRSASSLKGLLAKLETKPAPTAATIRQEIAAIPADKKKNYAAPLRYLYKHYPDLDEFQYGGFLLKAFLQLEKSDLRRDRALLAIQMVYRLCVQVDQRLRDVQAAGLSTTTAPAHWSAHQRKATELFQKWFDEKRPTKSLARAKLVFSKMQTALQNPNFEIVVYGVPEEKEMNPTNLVLSANDQAAVKDAFAFVIKAENAYRLYLASGFFKEDETRVDVARPGKVQTAQTTEAWQQEKRTKVALDAAVVTILHELTHISMIAGTNDVPHDPYNPVVCKNNAKNNPENALNNAENYALFAKDILFGGLFA